MPVSGAGSSDPDVGDSLTYAWDFDLDGAFDDATGVAPSFDLVGQDGVFTIRLRVTDTAGATATDTAQVTVANVAPTVGAITTDAPKPENSGVRIQGVISDPGWLDPLTASIDFGDGSGPQPLAGVLENVRPNATLTYDVTKIYGDNGTFTRQGLRRGRRHHRQLQPDVRAGHERESDGDDRRVGRRCS